MLQPYDVKWTVAAAGADYEMSVGQYTADTPEHLERYLTFLGSRLVFLIDWNRARKRLARLVGKANAVGLLKWAAENDIGHVGFLKAGDIRLIEAALERAAPLQMRLGARLDEWLGGDAARAFLMSVLRTTSSGLRAGHSSSLIEDEIEAELLRHLRTTDRHPYSDAADHAVIISSASDRLQSTLLRLRYGGNRDEAPRTAELTAAWTGKADRIVRHAGRSLLRAGDGSHLQRLLAEADCAADALEETAFLLTVIPASIDQEVLSLLGALADVVDQAARDYVRCLEESRELSAASASAEVDSFLLTVDRLAERGHHALAARRALTSRLLHGPGDFHLLFVVSDMAHGLERAAMALSRCGQIVRDCVLSTRLSR
jgi:hypothetical protein